MARLSGTSGSCDDIIANDIKPAGRAFLRVAAGDVAVESSRCGTWVKAETRSYNADPSRLADGEHRVGLEALAGTYQAPGGSGCYWARVSGWGARWTRCWPTTSARGCRS